MYHTKLLKRIKKVSRVRWFKISRFIIHLLGGVTQDEILELNKECYNEGRKFGENRAALYLVLYAKSIYGLDEQEWIDKMWDKLETFLDNKINETSD